MQISATSYAVTGLAAPPPWTVNTGFIVGRERTFIVDSGTTLSAARTLYGYARCARPQNDMLLINLEPHFDHIGGNCFFEKQGIAIYAHAGVRRTPEEFRATKEEYNQCIPSPVRKAEHEAGAFFLGTTLTNPGHTIAGGDSFDLGGVEVEILATPGHTPYNLSVYSREDGVLFCADCIVNAYLPNLEAGERDDWRRWMLSLEAIRDLNPEIIVPGHGDIIRGPHVTNEITRMERIINTAIERGYAPTA